MELAIYIQQLLELLPDPAFCVENGSITHINAAAAALHLDTGMAISDLLATGEDVYRTYSGGCLFLKAEVCGVLYCARITRLCSTDIFLLEEAEPSPELRAMSLAAQHLRGPLAEILNSLDSLSESGADLSVLNRGVHQLLRTIGNMSDASRYAQDGKSVMKLHNIDMLISEICQKAAVLAESVGISLTYQGLERSLLCAVDAEKLERALYNLISNAVKFTQPGGTIEVSLSRQKATLHLSVSDSGSGIAAPLLPEAFQQYLRQPHLEDGRRGIGLGMTLVRSTALAHGGAVLLENNSTGGLTATMTIPIRQNPPTVHSNRLCVDYASERDHGLVELSQSLPSSLYK